MKIAFFISGLRGHGAERVLTFLANEWSARGWEVVILTMEDGRDPPFYPLAPGVELRHLDLLTASASPLTGLAHNFRRIARIRRAIREAGPSVLVSFIDRANILAVLASRGLGIPVVISERTDPSRRSLGRIWTALRNLAYPRADAVVFQSRAVQDWFPAAVRTRGVVIPNPVAPPPGPRISGQDGPRRLVAIGRLAPIKGFDLLLPAFAEASARVPGWTLEIWGEGPERPALEAQIQRLGLADRVRLPGQTDRPFEVLLAADLFVLPSRAEGFPNALAEAMACGLPVLSTDFGGAVREMVEDGVDGLLVPPEDPAALAEALARLMGDPEARRRLGARAGQLVERFSAERVLAQWEETLVRVQRARPSPRRDACPT